MRRGKTSRQPWQAFRRFVSVQHVRENRAPDYYFTETPLISLKKKKKTKNTHTHQAAWLEYHQLVSVALMYVRLV